MNRAMRRASEANGRRMMKQGWTPWEDWTDRAYATEAYRNKPRDLLSFHKNGIYTVQEFLRPSPWGEITLLMVRRNDAAPVRSWGDLQRIKNELTGPERVAVEVYPAETDLVDDANIYHLWVLPAGFVLPFGLHISSRGQNG